MNKDDLNEGVSMITVTLLETSPKVESIKSGSLGNTGGEVGKSQESSERKRSIVKTLKLFNPQFGSFLFKLIQSAK